jgi:hypothetical protein
LLSPQGPSADKKKAEKKTAQKEKKTGSLYAHRPSLHFPPQRRSTKRLTDRVCLGNENRWNSNFQQLLNMEDTESKFHKLAFLAHDFQHAAEGTFPPFASTSSLATTSDHLNLFCLSRLCKPVYGKIIISERYLPYEEKTLKPEKDMGYAYPPPSIVFFVSSSSA